MSPPEKNFAHSTIRHNTHRKVHKFVVKRSQGAQRTAQGIPQLRYGIAKAGDWADTQAFGTATAMAPPVFRHTGPSLSCGMPEKGLSVELVVRLERIVRLLDLDAHRFVAGAAYGGSRSDDTFEVELGYDIRLKQLTRRLEIRD